MKKRVILIVLDSVGAGALPDAAAYGDAGSSTLGHIYEQEAPSLPNLEKLGLGSMETLSAAGGLHGLSILFCILFLLCALQKA